jgi:hypothetical protein
MCIFQGIYVVLYLKLLVPTNHMSTQDPGASSQYVLSSRHIIGSVPQDLTVQLDDGHTCHSVQLNHSDYLTADREIDNLVHLNNR